jgi:hypothetical protein
MPYINPNCSITREQLDARQADIDKRPSSMLARLNDKQTLEWYTHTFPNGKTSTFYAWYDKDGVPLRPMGKKSAGNLSLTMPPALVSLNRMDPAGAGFFVKDTDETGRYKWTIGVSKPGDEFFDDKYESFGRCYNHLMELFTKKLPNHFARGKNTQGIDVRVALPVIAEKWEKFRESASEHPRKTIERETRKKVFKEAYDKLRKDKVPKDDATAQAKVIADKAGKEAAEAYEIDEEELLSDFYDSLVDDIFNKDNKFMRPPNFSIFNAEILTIDFDMRGKPLAEREMNEKDQEYYDAWAAIYPNFDVDEEHATQHKHLKKIMKGYKIKFDTENPLKFNRDEFTIIDSAGDPMEHHAAVKSVNWRGSTVTISTTSRAIDFKSIDGAVQCISHLDMTSVQVEVDGVPGGNYAERPIGSSVNIFGAPKPKAIEPPPHSKTVEPPLAIGPAVESENGKHAAEEDEEEVVDPKKRKVELKDSE